MTWLRVPATLTTGRLHFLTNGTVREYGVANSQPRWASGIWLYLVNCVQAFYESESLTQGWKLKEKTLIHFRVHTVRFFCLVK